MEKFEHLVVHHICTCRFYTNFKDVRIMALSHFYQLMKLGIAPEEIRLLYNVNDGKLYLICSEMCINI